uniref:Uncharacterized protein n=1 Tax=Oryza nivara TaxID=4536 RepID=A0A0E0J8K9_ORYNI
MATISGKFGIIMVAMILVVRIIAFASASDNDELPKPGKAAQVGSDCFNECWRDCILGTPFTSLCDQLCYQKCLLLCASGPRQTSLCLPMVTVKLWNANHKSRSPSTSNSGLILSQANRIEVRVGVVCFERVVMATLDVLV